jgi:hypothetical protein
VSSPNIPYVNEHCHTGGWFRQFPKSSSSDSLDAHHCEASYSSLVH